MSSATPLFIHSIAPLDAPLATPAAGSQKNNLLSLSIAKNIATTKYTDGNKKLGKVAFPTMEGLSFEKIKNITFLEAQGNYTMLHFEDGRQVLVSKTLSDVEEMLPTHYFVRIHRSHTVHLRHLKRYVRGKGGHVVLQNGIMLTVSVGQKDHFLEAVRLFFNG